MSKAKKEAKEKKSGVEASKARKAVKAPAKRPAARKPTGAAKPKPSPKPKAGASSKVVFTSEEVQLRAYFIAERRRNMGWPGDEAGDWLEAERQLKAEAARRKG